MPRPLRSDEWPSNEEFDVAEFYETKAGRTFFELTLPRLIAAIERLAEALEKAVAEQGQAGNEAG